MKKIITYTQDIFNFACMWGAIRHVYHCDIAKTKWWGMVEDKYRK